MLLNGNIGIIGDSVRDRYSIFYPVKEKTIGYDCYAAHGHGQCSQDGVKLSQESRKRFKRIEHPCRNRDEHNIFLGHGLFP